MYCSNIMFFCLLILYATHVEYSGANRITQEVQLPPGQDCVMAPVVHVLKHPGCIEQYIPSFACVGKCSSYLQVSGSKIWQMERSCNCCQESGEREATVELYCPEARKEENRYRKWWRNSNKNRARACRPCSERRVLKKLLHTHKIVTKAPLECMCRPCGTIDANSIIPQETIGYAEEGPLHNHFRKTF